MAEKTADGGPATDLLGDPWTPPRDPRGRKRHKRLPQIAEKIAVLRATGATKEAVAASVGLSVPTLEKYYFRELDDGPALAQAQLDRVMWKKAMDGNVSAAKYVRDRFKDGDASLASARARSRAMTPEAPVGHDQPAAKLGKKAERQAQAEKVASNGRFAPSKPPVRLAVSNP
jgi:hypothetical protein